MANQIYSSDLFDNKVVLVIAGFIHKTHSSLQFQWKYRKTQSQNYYLEQREMHRLCERLIKFQGADNILS